MLKESTQDMTEQLRATKEVSQKRTPWPVS